MFIKITILYFIFLGTFVSNIFAENLFEVNVELKPIKIEYDYLKDVSFVVFKEISAKNSFVEIGSNVFELRITSGEKTITFSGDPNEWDLRNSFNDVGTSASLYYASSEINQPIQMFRLSLDDSKRTFFIKGRDADFVNSILSIVKDKLSSCYYFGGPAFRAIICLFLLVFPWVFGFISYKKINLNPIIWGVLIFLFSFWGYYFLFNSEFRPGTLIYKEEFAFWTKYKEWFFVFLPIVSTPILNGFYEKFLRIFINKK